MKRAPTHAAGLSLFERQASAGTIGTKGETPAERQRREKIVELMAMSDLRLSELFSSFCPRMTWWRWRDLNPSALLVAMWERHDGAKQRLAGLVADLEREFGGSA